MHDTLIQTLFYIFAGLAVASAIMVISQNNPVRCVLFLVLTFFASSVLWILVEAEFLALILVLVYVGAVMTLFLFVVMMLNIDIESMKGRFLRYLPMGLFIVALLTGLLLIAVPRDSFKQSVEASSQLTTSNTEALGMVLYTDYFLAFELAAVLLLVAIVSAITLVHRGAVRSKRQNIREQIMTRAEDRIELVQMKSEK
ncbi:MAG: NADH-quinone oxidoreductase subunit J [Legionella sp.]|jgi:NADH-quinone oxidoreductase subunit J